MSIKEKVSKITKFIWWVINPVSGANFIDRIMPPGGKRRIEYDKKQTEKKYNEKVENYFKLSDSETAEFWKGIDHRKYLKYEKDLKKAEEDELTDYEKWCIQNDPTDQELEYQSKKRFFKIPKISIVVPLYKTDLDLFRELLYSVHCQTYSNWELCLADGSPKELTEIQKMCENDKRIKYKFLGENKGISRNTNEAISLATGKYIALLDHDDMLSLNALYEVVKAINENKNADVIYSDEDKFHFIDEGRYSPRFKPDYSPDYLRANNYICHLSVIKKDLLDKIGKFNSDYDGSQDYDLMLRATEKAKNIVHIPKVLYHWRVHKGSTSMEAEAKPYTVKAGKRALEAHLKRINLDGKVTNGQVNGTYNIDYQINGNPKVSIIINNQKCIENIKKITTYKNYEIIESPDKASEYIAIVNENTVIKTPDWIEKMLGFAQREDVGAVGVRSFYPDNKTQNAGIAIGGNNGAQYLFEGLEKSKDGYFGNEKIIQNLSAVSNMCMMIRKNIFNKIGGFSNEFSGILNSADICLKVRKSGKLVVYNPTVEVIYTGEKEKISNEDINKFCEKWKEKLEKNDEYYNPNFSLENGNCEIKYDEMEKEEQ